MVMGLTAVSAFAGKSGMLKSLMMTVLGLMLATIGTDQTSGVQRFTFGSLNLLDGISFLMLAMATFALTEAMFLVFRRESVSDDLDLKAISNWSSLKVTMKEFKFILPSILRSSVLGFFIGVLPGSGGTLGSFLSYGMERNLAPPEEREKFGKGSLRGLAAPETGNNAASSGSFVPLLTLGIPGSGTTAVMLGALIAYGIEPGPRMFIDRPEVFWAVIMSMYLGNIFLLILQSSPDSLFCPASGGAQNHPGPGHLFLHLYRGLSGHVQHLRYFHDDSFRRGGPHPATAGLSHGTAAAGIYSGRADGRQPEALPGHLRRFDAVFVGAVADPGHHCRHRSHCPGAFHRAGHQADLGERPAGDRLRGIAGCNKSPPTVTIAKLFWKWRNFMNPNAYFVVYLAVGALGGLAGAKLKIPAGVLIGAMVSVIVFKWLFRADWPVPKGLNFTLQVLVGVMVAATFHPAMLKSLSRIWLPVLMSTIVLVGAGVVMSLIFSKMGLLDMGSAYWEPAPVP